MSSDSKAATELAPSVIPNSFSLVSNRSIAEKLSLHTFLICYPLLPFQTYVTNNFCRQEMPKNLCHLNLFLHFSLTAQSNIEP